MVVTDRPRDDHGRYQGQAYSDSDFLDAVVELETATTTKIADAVDCERTTAHKRLRDLESDGQLDSENLGNVIVWAISD